MASGVLIAGVKCRDQALCKRKVRGSKLGVGLAQIRSEATLLLVHEKPALSRQSRHEKERKGPWRDIAVGEHEHCDHRSEEGDRGDDNGKKVTDGLRPTTEPAKTEHGRRKCGVRISATVAAMSLLPRTSPGPEGSNATTPNAVAPAAAPTNARLNRYVSRPAIGILKPTAEAPKTAMPANGPNSTAANTDGNSQIETVRSVRWRRRQAAPATR